MDSVAISTLSRRLFASYAIVFAGVLLVFALAIRFAFVASLEHQVDARLETLARAGLAGVRFEARGFMVETNIARALRPNQEGLQWFDAAGNIVESRGLVPQRNVRPSVGKRESIAIDNDVLLTRTIEILDGAGHVAGRIRASESDDALTAATQALDLGITIGTGLTILTASVGGWYLTRQAIRSSEVAFAQLRQFTADAAHELRGPIGALATTAQLALHEDPQAAHGRLSAIVEISAEMRRLVEDLLILARAGQPITRELFATDLEVVLDRVCERLSTEAAAKRVRIDRSRVPLPVLYGNPEQLERIVANLVENAIRYGNHSGTVEIRGTTDSTHVQLSVSDDGIGIAPEHVPFIFDRFWRADPIRGPHGGSGLGLSIALALARRHGGNIAVSTTPRTGSTFTLSLPRRPAG